MSESKVLPRLEKVQSGGEKVSNQVVTADKSQWKRIRKGARFCSQVALVAAALANKGGGTRKVSQFTFNLKKHRILRFEGDVKGRMREGGK